MGYPTNACCLHTSNPSASICTRQQTPLFSTAADTDNSRHQTAILCLPYPSTTTAAWCSATSQDQQEGGGHLLLQAFAPKRCTQHWHPTIYKQHPLQKGGVPRLRSVHADWGCPTTDPPNGVCTLVVAALCSSVCIAVCCCAFDFEFWNLNESADTPS